MPRPLGRRPSEDDTHIRKFPFSTVAPQAPTVINKVLKLPNWHWTHDQGHEGSCVGHGTVMERAITNTNQNILNKILGIRTRRYDPIDIWNEAKRIDEWPDTNPGDDNGTSVRAAYDVLRNSGPRRVKSMELINGVPTPVGEQDRNLDEGILTNRWATSVDEVRTAISQGIPVSIGISWYEDFDTPEVNTAFPSHSHEYWIAPNGIKGASRGGHCVCIYGASDRLQAVRIKNSWGRSYPLVWLPYKALERLITENGEIALVTDK